MEEVLDLVHHVAVEVLGQVGHVTEEVLDQAGHVTEADLLPVVTGDTLDFYHCTLGTHFAVVGTAPFCRTDSRIDHYTSEDLAPVLVETFLDDGLVEARPETA